MRMSKRIVCILLTVATLMMNFTPANAAISTEIYQGALSGTTRLTLTLYDTTNEVKILEDSNVQHTSGISTSIGVPSTVTKSSTASSSILETVGAANADIATSIVASAGVADAVSFTNSVSVRYTIPASEASGLYRIENVFPRSRVNFKITDIITNMVTLNKTVAYMPRIGEAHVRIYRYSDITN